MLCVCIAIGLPGTGHRYLASCKHYQRQVMRRFGKLNKYNHPERTYEAAEGP